MNSPKIHDILDSIKMNKSTNARMVQDKIYNQSQGRSSVIPKKNPNTFDIGKVQFKMKMPSLKTGPMGPVGENSIIKL
jgi:hypothetical protein